MRYKKHKIGELNFTSKITNGKGGSHNYYTRYLTLDTETSSNKYYDEKDKTWKVNKTWIYDSAVYDGYKYSNFRHVTDLVDYLYNLNANFHEYILKHGTTKQAKYINNYRIIIFVHNLSYDMSYLYNFLVDKFAEDGQPLLIKPHKFLSYIIGHLEFRCSYLLTNKSLDKCCQDYNVEVKKLTGQYDYTKVRYPNTPLSDTEKEYMKNDVISLHQVIKKILEKENLQLCELPLTSTGFVRNDCRNEYLKDERNITQFVEQSLISTTYKLLERAFCGGATGGNVKHVNKLLKGNIKHFDFTSHYPTQLMLEKFPCSHFTQVHPIVYTPEMIINDDNYCYIMTIEFVNIRIKDNKIPYIMTHKVSNIDITNMRTFNGKVFRVDGICQLHLTDVDLKTILNLYDFDGWNISYLFKAKKDYIPKWLYNVIKTYFNDKTKYKYVLKDCEENGNVDEIYDASYNLLKAKNKFNGIYGMTATRPIRDEIIINADNEHIRKFVENDELQEKLNKYYYNCQNNFANYEIGVYTTAYARHYLYKMFDIIGHDNIIYFDTDSCFFFANDDNLQAIKEFNVWYTDRATQRGATTTHNNKVVNLGYFDDENENITKFKFLHSKCYCYETDDKQLHVTIAGVNRKGNKDGITLYNFEELQSIENFNDGFTFHTCGGTTAKYIIDTEIHYDKEHDFYYSEGCVIVDVDKQISFNGKDYSLYKRIYN